MNLFLIKLFISILFSFIIAFKDYCLPHKTKENDVIKLSFFLDLIKMKTNSKKSDSVFLDPKSTEIWFPEPPLVSPSNKFNGVPSDAIVLFSRNDLNEWVHANGEIPKWVVREDFFQVKPGSGDIFTKKKFGSCQIHIEFKTPIEITNKGQGRGNSGIYFMADPDPSGNQGYEIQILDSYNNRTYSNGQAGSVYKQHIPLVNASREPGKWQSYDIVFKAPYFSESGYLDSPAYFTVFHNGILIQNNVQIQGITKYIGYPEYKNHIPKLPIKLQDHGDKVSFRNIWIREL